ncbi:pirin family protein [Aquabacterium parvum]|uniref:pirin family protein n=1 Tax=Aquabacterium parvum TaxID=70584 RepID=UPI000718B81F|nr:pirin family protein [Aquabacterium parvum]
MTPADAPPDALPPGRAPEPLVRLRGRDTTLAGALTVRRVLPAAAQRSVGPFIFFDHFGPVTLPPEVDTDVGGHPHIGLATVTYLFEGGFVHRDSLGTVQPIAPGAINWMVAGRGVVHSERVPEAERGQPRRLHGLQLWVALPPELAQCEPSFQHAAAAALPHVMQQAEPSGQAGRVSVRVLVGEAFGVRSPVRTASPTLYLDITLPPGASWTLPPLAEEQAIFSPEDALEVDGEVLAPREMAVLPAGAPVSLRVGAEGARLVLIGGQPLAQPVRMWWNFVATDPALIERAAADWAAGGFAPIPGETDRIPAPAWRGLR